VYFINRSKVTAFLAVANPGLEVRSCGNAVLLNPPRNRTTMNNNNYYYYYSFINVLDNSCRSQLQASTKIRNSKIQLKIKRIYKKRKKLFRLES
jgi:hypothetical protein